MDSESRPLEQKTNGSNEAKTLKLHFGASSWTLLNAVTTATDWRVEADIWNITANQQYITWICFDGTTVTQGYETAAIDTSLNVTVKLTGEVGGTGTDVISQTMWIVERM